MSELLESRWQDTKTALLEGLQGNKKSVMAATLENTRKYLSESATAGATSAGNVATLNRVILPVIRRVLFRSFPSITDGKYLSKDFCSLVVCTDSSKSVIISR